MRTSQQPSDHLYLVGVRARIAVQHQTTNLSAWEMETVSLCFEANWPESECADHILHYRSTL